MRKIIGFLFPWVPTFKRLELEKRWWHRLAVVLFFIALAPLLLYSWVIGDDANSPVHSSGGEIQYWEIAPPLPGGYTIVPAISPNAPPPDSNVIGYGEIATPLGNTFDVLAANARNSDLRKTIEMPDGTTVTYPGTASDEAIKSAWIHKLRIATAKAVMLGFGIAVLATLIFSYMLQVGYRAVLYVIYGAKAGAGAGAPAAD